MEFTARRNAMRDDLSALWNDISDQDVRCDARGVLSRGFLTEAAARCSTYVVRSGPNLAGICFVADAEDRREMCFLKTRWLCDRHPLAYAKGVRGLLALLARLEAEAGRDAKPMYFHPPDDGGRAAAFFVRAGCTVTERGLLCPGKESENG